MRNRDEEEQVNPGQSWPENTEPHRPTADLLPKICLYALTGVKTKRKTTQSRNPIAQAPNRNPVEATGLAAELSS